MVQKIILSQGKFCIKDTLVQEYNAKHNTNYSPTDDELRIIPHFINMITFQLKGPLAKLIIDNNWKNSLYLGSIPKDAFEVDAYRIIRDYSGHEQVDILWGEIKKRQEDRELAKRKECIFLHKFGDLLYDYSLGDREKVLKIQELIPKHLFSAYDSFSEIVAHINDRLIDKHASDDSWVEV
jgi:hypothetical protein